MKLTKQLEAEVMQAHETYWESYLKGDVKSLASLLDEGYSQIGSVESEVFFNKKDAVNFVQTTIDQVAGKVEMRNRITKLEPGEEFVLITEQCDLYVFIEGEWNFYSKFRASSMMQQKEGEWKMIHQHSSLPDSKAQEGENIATEKIAAENLQLREAIKRRTVELEQKNRELEIETALERVRVVAMGMKNPDDMLDVCRIIAEQLASLNIKEIRNVQTAIFYESKGTYVNYEYYAKHHKLLVTEVDFKNHQIQAAFANQMLKGAGELFNHSLAGKELIDWYNFQKTTNQFVDAFLEQAASLNYYWYSLGPVALGISTYLPLSEDELNLFKRFLNVFELSYRRFLDIEIAISQARDAQTEASLERVRAQALGMRTPNDLTGICEVLFSELVKLGFKEIRNAMINIHDDEKGTFINYDYSDEIGKSINHLHYNIHPVIEKQIKQIRSGGDAFSETSFTGKDLADWKTFRKKIGEQDDPRIENIDALHYYFYSIGTGSIGISTFQMIAAEKLELLKRFRNVFDFAYRRYMDIAQAETQAREAQVELALERVRARTMAMQRSEELAKTVSVLFKQLLDLGIQSIQLRTCGIVTFNIQEPVGEVWITDTAGEIVADSFITRYDEAPVYKKIYDGWKKEEKFLVISLLGEAFYEHINYLLQHTKIPVTDTSFIQKMEPEMHLHVLYFSQGYLFIITYKPMPEYHEIFKRFGAVFQQTYTRFLDFKKAEAQAREAQIELGLERVRARTMSMQKSDELGETAAILFQQLRSLDLKFWSAGVFIWNHDQNVVENWMGNNTGGTPLSSMLLRFKDDDKHRKIYEASVRGELIYEEELRGEALAKHYEWMKSHPSARMIFEQLKSHGINLPSAQWNYAAIFKQGYLLIIAEQPEPGINDISKRFAKVFEQTYTRFLDLQKAEAQAREAKIETALERVRSRTMAMQHSDELKEAAALLFQQVISLGVPAYSCGYNIWEKDEKEFTSWMSSQDGSIINGVSNIPLTEDANFIRYVDSKQKGEQFFVLELRDKRMQEHYQYLKTIPAFKTYFDYAVSVGFDLPETQIHHLANFSKGNLLFITLEPCPEFHDVFKRFAAVFEQTYTRFLDLQKAEAQAREAQIEAALEKVRSRSLAVQKSNELKEVVTVIFEKLKALKIPIESASINISIEGSKDLNVYACGQNEDTLLTSNYRLPYFDHPIPNDILNAWEKGLDFFRNTYLFEDKNSFYNYEFEHSDLKYLPDEIKKMILQSQRYNISMAFAKNSMIVINDFDGRLLSETETDILRRFAKVFEQAYIRFLDLQKAEIQAREAQIEASLERVRSRSMGMQKSEELKEVIQVVYEQFVHLNINIGHTGFVMDYKTRDDYNIWIADPLGVPSQVIVPYFDSVYYNRFNEAKKNEEDFFATNLSFEEKNKFYKKLFEYIPELPEESKEFYFSCPGLAASTVLLENVCLYIENFSGMSYTGEENNILMRFGKVFQQTYTRFLDLQKAEAQAREAQIELGLERVRARAMAMQKSGELSELVDTVFKELTRLDFALTWCIINIIDESSMSNTVWAANPDINKAPESYHMLFEDYPFHDAMMKGWKERKIKSVYTLEGDEKRIYDDYLFNETEFRRTPEAAQAASRAMEKYVVSFSFSNFGGLQTVGDAPLSNANLDILSRFGKVFDLTYTRFNDLKQAEAQARESQIQLAMERVRARTMAMQRSEELAETAAVLFQQFKDLGQSAIQITIGVMNEPNNQIELQVTDWNGGGEKINRTFNVSIDEPTVGNKMYTAWKAKQKSAVIDLTGEELKGWVAYRNALSGVTDSNANVDKRRVISFGFFSRGLVSISTPELCPPETIQLLERFAAVFDGTYTRFLDLKQAEEQAKEAQVEAALEKVRSRTMAMQRSEELPEAANSLFLQVQALGIPAWSAGYCIWDADKQGITLWMSSEGVMQPAFHAPLTRDPSFIHMKEAHESGDAFHVEAVGGDALVNHYQYMRTLPVVGEILDSIIAAGHPLPAFQIFHCAYFSQGFLLFITYEPVPVAHTIFKRFTNVFEQTYTRFLDLQKSEAQAREARIEAALEKVRSRTMGMQQSHELGDVATVLFKELNQLVENLWTCGFVLCEKNRGEDEWWLSTGDGFIPAFYLPNTVDPTHANIYDAWKKGETYHTEQLEREALQEHYDWLMNIPVSKNIFDEMKAAGNSLPTWQKLHCAYFSYGYLVMITQVPCPEEQIFKRFAQVFDQTYTRFLDLQKAEAQVRESKIEAALERTRTQSMIMQHSNELDDTLRVFHEQVLLLGIHSAFSFLWLPDEEKDRHIFWAVWGEGKNDSTVFKSKAINYPLDRNEPATAQCLIDWKSNEPVYSYYVPPPAVENYFAVWQELIDGVEQLKPEYFSHGLYYVEAFMKHGCFGVMVANDLTEVEKKILCRFAVEFERTYTRFLDLQKAEAQTRQAQIETAMEKVRARALAMQKPAELVEVAQVLRKEMGLLGVEELETSSIYIHDVASGKTECWYAIKDIREPENKLVLDHMIMQLSETWVGRQMLEFYQSDKKQISILMQGANRKEWIQYCIGQSKVFDHSFYGADIPDRTYHLNKFSNGYIGAASNGEISAESWELLKRATAVFSLAYTRFSDLQKSEASAREAVRQASLDRVRAETASMRTTADLERITPLMWNELTTQGVPFIRCGVFIMDEQQQQIHTFLSTPDGAAIAAFHLPYHSPGTTAQVLKHWKQKKIYKEHWNEAAFMEWTKNLEAQGAITSSEKYLTQHHPSNLDLHFLPFLQGMLYVGSETVLSDEELHLVQNLADAFSTAYARYEDFNKLEAAKEQIEQTLVNLKQAQAQLVQSEKMASLGELTAGIAHEIQNPLNFVNNFSEVNTELIEELKGERQKAEGERNTHLEDELLTDLANNMEKINHHGKRADAIVKGMLQHSRTSTAVKEATDINKLSDEYLRLAYHGLRAKDKSFNATLKTDYDESIGKINIIPQDIGRVILNLINNAFYVVSEKQKAESLKQKAQDIHYEPTVTVSTKKTGNMVELKVSDNGNGIPQKVLDKIFQPFFTTKPTGQGTGLGLSLSYDIVKAHGGEIKVNSFEGAGSEFIIQLPI